MRAAVAAALIFAAGCEPKDTICTDQLVWSVALTLQDGAEAPISGATLTVTDGTHTETCEEGEAGQYACGAEMAGELTISIEADGFEAEEVDVAVESDECHVLPEQLTHTLSAVGCTTEERASVVVQVYDDAGARIASAEAHYTPPDTDGIEPCEPVGDAFWCGAEIPGEIEVLVDAEGYTSHAEVVDVALTPDGCHVETESLDVVLAAE